MPLSSPISKVEFSRRLAIVEFHAYMTIPSTQVENLDVQADDEEPVVNAEVIEEMLEIDVF